MYHLIADPDIRRARAADKEQIILEFLKEEVYTSLKVLMVLLGINRSATESALKRLEAKAMVKRAVIDIGFGKGITLWGITPTGFDEVILYSERGIIKPRWFAPDKVKPLQLAHTLDIHYARIFFLAGFLQGQWIPSRNLPGQNATKASGQRWPGYPDALLKVPEDEYDPDTDTLIKTYAIEVERTKKTPARYPAIIKQHIRNMEVGRYNHVIYLLPNRRKAENLKMDFEKYIEKGGYEIDWLDADEERHVICTEEVINWFSFINMEEVMVKNYRHDIDMWDFIYGRENEMY